MYNGNNLVISDSDGNPVDDPFNLEYGEIYTVSWFEGTQYHETNLAATSKCYVDTDGKPNFFDAYEIPGELTKEGYAEYDLSEIPAGLYHINRGALIRIE